MFALAAAAGAALLFGGYQSFAPTGQWFGRAFCRGRRGSRQIALTFDDGPNDPHTLKLLDVLSKHDVHATFFLIGQYVRRRPDIVAEIAKRGHVIGNHTFTHPLLILQSASRIRHELLQCREAIHDAVGEHSNLFRPPWGGRRPAVLRIARGLRFPWPLAYALVVVPKPIRNFLYDVVARNRYRWFGRREACLVPSPRSAPAFSIEGGYVSCGLTLRQPVRYDKGLL